MDQAIAGASAGFVGTIVGYPLDSIKTRMQTGYQGNIWNIVTRVWKEEGVSGFFRGIANPLVSLVMLNTLNFSLYDMFRHQYQVNDQKLNKKEFEYKVPLAAASVSPFASMISTSFEMVKTQMVVNPASGQEGALKVAKNIVSNFGFQTLYRAHVVNTLRECVFLSTYFTVYEHFKIQWRNTLVNYGIPSSIAIPLSGGAAGAAGWFFSLPLDGIKSRIQGASIMKPRQYTAFQVAGQIVKEKGMIGLYSGAAPSIARAFIVSAVRFSAYENVLLLFSK